MLPQMNTYLKVLVPKSYVKEDISEEQLAKDTEYAKEYSRKKVRVRVWGGYLARLLDLNTHLT